MATGKTLLRRALKIGGVTIAVLVVLVLILSIFRVSIPLGFLRGRISSAASQALGREIRIESSPRLVIGFSPAFYIDGCSIGNPPEWSGEAGATLAELDRFFVKLGLFPLLRNEVRIDDLEISGLHLNLEKRSDGRTNWEFENLAVASGGETTPAGPGPGYQFRELRRLSIEDVILRSLNPEGEVALHLALDSVEGRAASRENLTLDFGGTFQAQPFKGKFRGSSLRKLLADREAWPYELTADFDAISLSLSGHLGTRDFSVAGEHDFAIDTPDLAKLEDITGPLPRFGAVRLTGKLRFTQEGIALPVLTGNLGETVVNGELHIDTTAKPPRLDGNLNLGIIDVAVFKKAEAAGGDDSGKPPGKDAKRAESNGEAAALKARLKQAALLPVVGEIRLAVAEVVNPKAKLRHLDMGVQLEESALTADVSVEFAGVPLRGNLAIRKHDRAENPVTLALDLVAGKGDIGELASLYSGSSGFTGEFERLRCTVAGAGADLDKAWNQTQVGLEVTDAAITFAGKGKTLEFQLNRGIIDSSWNREARMEADGVCEGEAFRVKFNQLPGRRAEAAGQPPFLELTGTAFGATFRMAGETRRADTDPQLPLDLEVSGASLGRLPAFLGVPEAADLPYRVKGRILPGKAWRVDIGEGNLGNTQLSGEIGWKNRGGDGAAFLARLELGDLDFGELRALFTDSSKEDDGSGAGLDTPLLPAGVHVQDADIELKIAKLIFEDGGIANVSLAATIRDGRVEKANAPFRFFLEGREFTGAAGFDFRGDEPEADLELTSEEVDVGEILDLLGVAKGVELRAGRLGFIVRARGQTVGEILVGSDLEVTFSDALWVIRNLNTGSKRPIAIDSGSIRGRRGEDTVIALKGKVADAPLALEITTDGIDALGKGKEQVGILVNADLAGSTISLDGRALLPLGRADFDAKLTWTGEKLSDLDELFDVDLPPVGPVKLDGRIKVEEDGYSLSDLHFVFGGTDLAGNLSVNTRGKRPFLKVNLNTSRFQIADFEVKGWSPTRGTVDSEKRSVQRVVAADTKLAKLLSADVLKSHDAEITLNAKDVRSGQDNLGSGFLTATIKDGRLDVDSVELAIPGGNFTAEFLYHPRLKDYDWRLKLKTDHFDYGVLARMNDPETDSIGFLNVDVELENRRAPMDDFPLAHSSGHVNFEVCPEKMEAGLIDFWGANLLFAILPRIDPEQNAKANCILGRMQMENGLMTPELLGIDTTRVRVISEGSVDFKNDAIDLLFVPRPKRPEFLRAGTRIMVQGTFDDFHIETGPLPILGSLARMAGSTILFPINILSQKRLPEDGSDICGCAKRR